MTPLAAVKPVHTDAGGFPYPQVPVLHYYPVDYGCFVVPGEVRSLLEPVMLQDLSPKLWYP